MAIYDIEIGYEYKNCSGVNYRTISVTLPGYVNHCSESQALREARDFFRYNDSIDMSSIFIHDISER